MTDTECEATFEQLQRTMINAQLQWVTNQVDEVIRFGRTVTKAVYSRPDAPEEIAVAGLAEKGRKSRVNVSATRPYTPPEKLTILISALENAVIETEEMLKAVRFYFSSHTNNWGEIRLLRTDEPGRQPLIITPMADEKRLHAVATLRSLVATLKGII
jgi:hypothetical protein